MKKLSGKLFGPYYVYALIDPVTKLPFYIGKGLGNRVESHFIKMDNDKNKEVIGLTPEQIFDFTEDDQDDSRAKNKKINQLLELGYEPKDIARVICRKVNNEAAYTIEACLIKSIYGLDNLTNVQDGKNSARFCENDPEKNLPLLVQPKKISSLSLEKAEQSNEYYVYALIDPETKKIFYVGKGTGNRVSQHFEHAGKIDIKSDPAERLTELKRLLNRGHIKEDVAIILAHVNKEELAFLLETLYIKFVVGYNNLANIQPGNCAYLIRAKDDWELRSGMDIQKIIEPGAKRTELLDDFLGTGLDILLYDVRDKILAKENCSNLKFSNAKVAGAGELVIDANIDGNITMRIQVRQARAFQLQLIATSRKERNWLINHFKKLNAFPYKRKDFVFFPIAWRDTGVTKDTAIAAERAEYLIKLAKSEQRSHLPMDIENELLGGLPYERGISDEERSFYI